MIKTLPFCKEMFPTGSNYICDPPVWDTDIDYVVLTDGTLQLDDWLEGLGFKTNFEDYDLQDFRSYKNNNVNYILTESMEWYKRMYRATELAKKLNLKDKQQRIDLFDYVMYGDI